ncbi:MAG: DUF6485 family protein [Dehalococcoidales bacterium]|nr:DUF6485 family protein [Dehalococcoidales bacterium]
MSNMECHIKQNQKRCNCTYDPCPRKGQCCECIAYHLRMEELPACAFPSDIEKTYDRSFSRFARMVIEKDQSGKIT